jgi:hypothetical protein
MYYTNYYGEYYDMINGCPKNNPECAEISKIACHLPFYQNCLSGAIIGGVTSTLSLLLITTIIIVLRFRNIITSLQPPVQPENVNINDPSTEKLLCQVDVQ